MKPPIPVFISFNHKDYESAKNLCAALSIAGYTVWYDPKLQCSQEWHVEIDKALENAGAIVVLWSPNSMASVWVRHEATFAMTKGKYVPVTIQDLTILSPYDRFQSLDLREWDGKSESNAGIKNLMLTLDKKLITWWKIPLVFLQRYLLIIMSIITAVLVLYLLGNQSKTLLDQTQKQKQISKEVINQTESIGSQSNSLGRMLSNLDSQKAGFDKQISRLDTMSSALKKQSADFEKQLDIQREIYSNIGTVQNTVDANNYPSDSVELYLTMNLSLYNSIEQFAPISIYFSNEQIKRDYVGYLDKGVLYNTQENYIHHITSISKPHINMPCHFSFIDTDRANYMMYNLLNKDIFKYQHYYVRNGRKIFSLREIDYKIMTIKIRLKNCTVPVLKSKAESTISLEETQELGSDIFKIKLQRKGTMVSRKCNYLVKDGYFYVVAKLEDISSVLSQN